MKRLILLLLLSAVLTFEGYSQAFLRPHEWKKFRREIFYTTGISAFLGDLGGTNKDGKDYSPADLDLNQSRTAFGLGYRYRLKKHINVVGKFSYLIVRGDDQQTKNIYRNNRNLNFKSNIFELSGRAEFGIQKTRRGGGSYGVQKNYAKYKNIQHYLYGFIGLGVFYFNPYGRNEAGNWVALRPLHTEGQGLPGGPKQYKNYSISIPVGGYYKLVLKKIWSIGVEVGYRKTFTDYIDDVGSLYYPKSQLTQFGPDAAYMSDPGKGLIKGYSSPGADGTPAQRGDNEKDTFISLEVTLGYTFKQQRKSARLRSKF